MKRIIPFAALSLLLTSAVTAAPFMAVGDGAELFLTGALGVRSDDNIFLTKNGDSDVIFDVNPGIDLTFGKDAQFKGSLTAGIAFANYSDHTNLNTQLFGSDFVSHYDDGKMKLGFNVGFHELNQNAPDIRGLTRRDVFSTSGNGEVEVSQLTSVGAGLSFSHENYKRANYNDSDTFTIPVDFFYKWTPKTDLSIGYRYRNYDPTGSALASNDHFLNIGARGEFSPKLTGRIAVGLNTRRFDRGSDESQLGLDASFSYELSPKTNLEFGASNDFGTSPQGQQQKNFTINASAVTKFNDQWSFNVTGSYRATNYGTRTDDYYEASLGASYIVNANINIAGTYTYRNYSSVLSASEFTNNVFNIAANFRY